MTALTRRPDITPAPEMLDAVLELCEAISAAAGPRTVCPLDGCLLLVTDTSCPACRAAG